MHGLARILEPVRLRWPLVAATVLTAALGAATVVAVIDGAVARPQAQRRDVLARRGCSDAGPRPTAVATPQPVSALRHIELERRWLVEHESPAALDESLRTHVGAWEPFLYILDAQPRMAVAGPAHLAQELWTYEFGQDETGGVWLVQSTRRVTKRDFAAYDREIFLLPAGSSFRGVLDRSR